MRLPVVLASMLLSMGLMAASSPAFSQADERDRGEQAVGSHDLITAAKTASVYDFTLEDIDGNSLPLRTFRGKVLLFVNTASFCGNTPQYAGLQTMYEQYQGQGLEILAFPANNFGKQEPGTDGEIKNFCYTKYSLTFPLFSKISVKGADKHPLYQYLTEQSPFPGEVEWNFQKYLVDRKGNVTARYRPSTKPLSGEVIQDVERLLQER